MDRNKYFQGLNDFFKELEAKKIQNRVNAVSLSVKPNVIPKGKRALKLLMLKSIRRLFLT
jgi:hypothetical protein